MYGAGRAEDGDEKRVRTGEEAMEAAHAASFTLRTSGITAGSRLSFSIVRGGYHRATERVLTIVRPAT